MLTAVVYGELCMSADECMLTMCDDTADVTCERGECTCLAKATTMAPSTDTSKSFKNSAYSFLYIN